MRLTKRMISAVPQELRKDLSDLIDVFNSHESANRLKERYYEGHIRLSEVNLGLALPQSFYGLEIGCSWGEKAVDVLAARSMFDGFVGRNGETPEEITRLMQNNRLRAEYQKACRDELKFGCTFATLSPDKDLKCRIRFHSPRNASALWSGELGRIKCGLAIIDTVQDETDKTWRPGVLNYYRDDYTWVITRGDNDDQWTAKGVRHVMGKPLMVPMIWNATTAKPFGKSRLKESVRRLIQSYVRTVANASIGLEFATSPQKYIMGVTEEQYMAVTNEKFRTYVGSIVAGTTNPETGEKPNFGQLSQGSIAPHVEMMRILSTQFSAATGLTVTDVGVVNDANPTSSDAILAQSQTLVLLAEQLNTGNADSLYQIAQMAQAIARDVPMNELTEEERDIEAHFKNPAMPSVAVTADAAVKLASSREGFSSTDVFLEMIGFDQADIRRIKAQESRARGMALIEEIEKERKPGDTA